MTQTLTPGRKRALARAVAKAQLNHLLHLTTPTGGETRQQRRMRERIAAKTIRHMQKDKSRGSKVKKGGGESQAEKITGASVIQAPGQEGDQG